VVTKHLCTVRPETTPFLSGDRTGKGGQSVGMNVHYDFVQTSRTRQKQKPLKRIIYYQHCNGVEGGLSALVRGHGMRVKPIHRTEDTQRTGHFHRLCGRLETHRTLAGGGTTADTTPKKLDIDSA
jgi:hypothetical protein